MITSSLHMITHDLIGPLSKYYLIMCVFVCVCVRAPACACAFVGSFTRSQGVAWRDRVPPALSRDAPPRRAAGVDARGCSGGEAAARAR